MTTIYIDTNIILSESYLRSTFFAGFLEGRLVASDICRYSQNCT